MNPRFGPALGMSMDMGASSHLGATDQSFVVVVRAGLRSNNRVISSKARGLPSNAYVSCGAGLVDANSHRQVSRRCHIHRRTDLQEGTYATSIFRRHALAVVSLRYVCSVNAGRGKRVIRLNSLWGPPMHEILSRAGIFQGVEPSTV